MTAASPSASSPSSLFSNSITANSKHDLEKQKRSHQVAIAELTHLSATRPVYLKNGNIFFRTTIQKATAFEQKQLEMAEAELEKLNSS